MIEKSSRIPEFLNRIVGDHSVVGAYIGGSVKASFEFEGTDLDFFVILDLKEFTGILEKCSELVDRYASSIDIRYGPQIYFGYGIQYFLITSDNEYIDLYFEDEERFEPNPMMIGNYFLKDDRGFENLIKAGDFSHYTNKYQSYLISNFIWLLKMFEKKYRSEHEFFAAKNFFRFLDFGLELIHHLSDRGRSAFYPEFKSREYRQVLYDQIGFCASKISDPEHNIKVARNCFHFVFRSIDAAGLEETAVLKNFLEHENWLSSIEASETAAR